MKQFLLYWSIVIFSIFVGSQITEGVLLVPYWRSLSSSDFYSYYTQFGPIIGKYFTILTVVSALIPFILTIYSKLINSKGFNYAFVSSLLGILFVSTFYLYFKEANDSFYQAAFSDQELEKELITWTYWHWGRIIIELFSLFFLIIAIRKILYHDIHL